MHDAFADGRSFRVLTEVDQRSRESPSLEVATAMSGRSAVAALDRILRAAAAISRCITVDQSSEFSPLPGRLGVSAQGDPRLPLSRQMVLSRFLTRQRSHKERLRALSAVAARGCAAI